MGVLFIFMLISGIFRDGCKISSPLILLRLNVVYCNVASYVAGYIFYFNIIDNDNINVYMCGAIG